MSNQTYQALYLQLNRWFGAANAVASRVATHNPSNFTTKL